MKIKRLTRYAANITVVAISELKHCLVRENFIKLRTKSLKQQAKSLQSLYVIIKNKTNATMIQERLKTQKYLEYKAKEQTTWPHHRILRSCKLTHKDKVVIIALYSPNGFLTCLQKKILQDYDNLGYKVIAIIASETLDLIDCESIESCKGIAIVENKYFDFCSWAIGIDRFTGLENCEEVILTNDSITLRKPELALLENAITCIKKKDIDVCFLTESKEIEIHGQSYFIHLSKSGIDKGALDTFKKGYFFESKEELINNVEVTLLQSLLTDDFTTGCLYKAENEKNPTLGAWHILCQKDYPFIKVSALGFAKHKVSQKSINKYLDKHIKGLILEHLISRSSNHWSKASYGELESHFYNSIGALVSPRLSPAVFDISCQEYTATPSYSTKSIFTCILHAFYADIAIALIHKLASLEINFRLIITTNSEEKKLIIQKYCESIRINSEFYICENRGRDILPFLMVAREVELEDIPILHLHTKKSPHNTQLRDWGEYLFDSLAGNLPRTLSCIDLINNTNIGLIFSEYHDQVKDQINWGYDYDHASYLANLLKIQLNKDDFLVFPAGSMFWIHKSILKYLADIPWKSEKFEKEKGQIDGTLAHAFERMFVHASLKMGKEYIQVTSGIAKMKRLNKAHYNQLKHEYMFETVKDLKKWGSSYVAPRLKAKLKSFLKKNQGLSYEVDITLDQTTKKYLNLIVPTIEIEKIYGGLSTAFKVAKLIYEKNNFDGIRIIIITDITTSKSVENISEYFGIKFDLLNPSAPRSFSLYQVCNLYSATDRVIRVAKNDIFLATAWWTASIGRIILNRQKESFNNNHNLIYLIQDYECGFYQWGDHYLLARNTYCNEQTTAIINSVPLYEFFNKRFKFERPLLLPYSLNKSLKDKLISFKQDANRNRENIILCYARPSTPRNCFEILRNSISYWRENSSIQESWKVLFIGESFDSHLISDIANCECLGKLSLSEYAGLLAKAKVGVSLMVSPHPSYPPLEMASFGMKVITNNYESKDLSKVNSNIYSLDEVSPASISKLLDVLCDKDNFMIEEYIEALGHEAQVFPDDFSISF